MRLTLSVLLFFVLSEQSLFAKDILATANCTHPDTMIINIRGGSLSAGRLAVNGQNLNLRALTRVQYLDPQSQEIRNGEEVQVCRDEKLSYSLVLWGAGTPQVEFYFGRPIDGDTNHYYRTQFNLDGKGYDTNGDTAVQPVH